MVGKIQKNWSYTIPDGEHKGVTLWSGRYCAVVGIIFLKTENNMYILANMRGSGTPDPEFVGTWNCPCGFLEGDESGEEGTAREVYEETGLFIDPLSLKEIGVQTDPKKCNNGNVTIRYMTVIHSNVIPSLEVKGGEKNEVNAIKWIPISNIQDYEWAFDHEDLINETYLNHVINK